MATNLYYRQERLICTIIMGYKKIYQYRLRLLYEWWQQVKFHHKNLSDIKNMDVNEQFAQPNQDSDTTLNKDKTWILERTNVLRIAQQGGKRQEIDRKGRNCRGDNKMAGQVNAFLNNLQWLFFLLTQRSVMQEPVWNSFCARGKLLRLTFSCPHTQDLQEFGG